MVGAKVELHHVGPGTNVNGKRGQLVLLHVEFLQTLGSREDAVWYSEQRMSLSVQCLDFERITYHKDCVPY